MLKHSKAVMCFARPDLAPVVIEAGRSCPSLRVIRTAVENLDNGELEVELPQVNPSDPALILYTSGTTALPKGVTHTHRTLLANVQIVRKSVPDLERFLVMTQLAFASGICLGLLTVIGRSQIRVPQTTLALAFSANLSNAKSQKVFWRTQPQIVGTVKTIFAAAWNGDGGCSILIRSTPFATGGLLRLSNY